MNTIKSLSGECGSLDKLLVLFPTETAGLCVGSIDLATVEVKLMWLVSACMTVLRVVYSDLFAQYTQLSFPKLGLPAAI